MLYFKTVLKKISLTRTTQKNDRKVEKREEREGEGERVFGWVLGSGPFLIGKGQFITMIRSKTQI